MTTKKQAEFTRQLLETTRYLLCDIRRIALEYSDQDSELIEAIIKAKVELRNAEYITKDFIENE